MAKEKKGEKKMKTISAIGGYSMACNYMIGTGVLALPIVFNSASIGTSVLITMLASLLCGISTFWINEATARGWALVRHRQQTNGTTQTPTAAENDSGPSDSDQDEKPLLEDDKQETEQAYVPPPADNDEPQLYQDGEMADPTETANTTDGSTLAPVVDALVEPDYAIPTEEVLQLPSLCKLFMGNTGFLVYQFCVIIYLFSTLWGYASVVASSLTSNFLWVPQKVFELFGSHYFSGITCNEPCSYRFGCSEIYVVFMVLFTITSMFFGLMEVSDQALIQMVFTVFRYLVLGIMILTTGMAFFIGPYDGDAHQSIPYYYPQAAFKLSLNGLAKVIPAAVFSQVMHHSAPVLLQPVRNKKRLNTMFGSVLATACIFYISLAVICALYFGPNARSLASLNWATWNGKSWTDSGSRPIIPILVSMLIILFPAVSLVSSSPLNAITLSFMIMELMPGKIKDPKWRYYKLVLITCRCLAIIPPIFIAAFVRCLTMIVQVCGITGFALCLIFPPLLQLTSQRKLKKIYGDKAGKTPYTNIFSFWPIPVFVIIVGVVFAIVTTSGMVTSWLGIDV
ncbi:Amino acid transporter, transmembrane [Carpediemonas membranifera]|uniref:Amino acid transporter, transmembrane n=1 Tax=Carpediemonas membranifera TaxID=201153 RepID=A0A8J6E1T7_9EUKA|nr:Amino acid transporter, transmembrane [Carpediemonas membranifera]|eukprot:KAG9391057.1 Amino acid transporter, transmembrane [Carpediemonas membranifera]